MAEKRQPAPARCPVCGRLPNIAKVKAGRWVADCVGRNCTFMPRGVGATEKEAVEAWNEEVGKRCR